MIPIDDHEDLAETLKLLRVLAGLTQTELGEMLGTNPSRIGKYETGASSPARARTLIRHLAALGHRLAIIPLDAQESDVLESVTQESSGNERDEHVR